MRRLALPLRILVAAFALAAIGAALWQLERAKADLIITHTGVGHIPVTVFRAPATTKGPVVVIAHGFAGSQQLMQPFAQTLAHNGYIAVTFDFTGEDTIYGGNYAITVPALKDEVLSFLRGK